MKTLLILLFWFLPLHALLVTIFKCKLWWDTDIFRFWKEIIIILLFIKAISDTYFKYNWNISRLYKNNYILGMATTFSIFSFFYIFFPFFIPKLSGFLWFKYDVFFIFALIIWLYLKEIKIYFHILLKTTFTVIIVSLSIFLPWYLFWDISHVSHIFGFSSEVSTYTANQCISFSQNVNGQHRFQWTFSGPIRWSVFLTITYTLFIWYFFDFLQNTKKTLFISQKNGKRRLSEISYLLFIAPSILIIVSIFFSYSKTSLLGFVFWIALFVYLVFSQKYQKKISTKFFIMSWFTALLPLAMVALMKKDLFLHLGAIINRFDNLKTSFEMLLYNPLWYGLWIAGPASWTGQSIESAWSWQIAVASTARTHTFLPENWYVQILLEQWIIGLWIFIGLLFVIWLKLSDIIKKRKDYFSIWLYTSYITLLFMANFTHAFEESATSYILFLIIWSYIAQNNIIKKHKKK